MRATKVAVLLLLFSPSIVVNGCARNDSQRLVSYQIRDALIAQPGAFPANFADLNLYENSDPQRPNFGLVPYLIRSPLYTDGALKTRYVFVPPDKKIAISSEGQFEYPNGTAFIKQFLTADGKPIETRIMVKEGDKSWKLATYVWDRDGKVTKNETPQRVTAADGKEYRVPSEKECVKCHSGASAQDPVLGFMPDQIKTKISGRDLVAFLQSNGLFETASSSNFSKLKEVQPAIDYRQPPGTASVGNNLASGLAHSAPVTPFDLKRVRAYLGMNCGTCHRPDGDSKGIELDLRESTPLLQTGLIKGKYLIPKDVQSSKIWQVYTAEKERMPPLSIRKDPLGEELIKGLIENWPETAP
jgi:mono/diheme cytochrome c family protein